ncbi:hypothetical protein HanPSC8_Chr01g0002521 [Helianthus annuus]|nr:hypothetical protein HanPSC8_Chr01g0002521 [Helianthus annuus]
MPLASTSLPHGLPVAAAAVRVNISPWDLTLTAELTAATRCSRSAPIASAASTHCAATNVAADATAILVLAICSSLLDAEAAAVAAAMVATAAATPATDTAAWSCALWARVSSFFFSLLSFNHRPTVFPAGVVLHPPAPYPLLPLANNGWSVLFARKNCSCNIKSS